MQLLPGREALLPATSSWEEYAVTQACATVWTRLLAVALLVASLFFVPGPAALAQQEPALPDAPYYGAVLNWADDSAAAHAERLGAPAALYGQNVPFPLTSQELSYLKAYFAQVAAEGSHALITVEPRQALAEITDDDASDFARQLADAATHFQGQIYVRYAPEMNAPWRPWGQQPEAFRAAFSAVASAVDSTLGNALMVWSPTAAEDYPFRDATSEPGSGVSLESVDTNGDGVWNQDDAAYDPYYPGDEYVDWVGLFAYHDPVGEAEARNTIPDDGAFRAALDPSGPDSADDFYTAYAEDRNKPVMVETGAFYSPGAPGAAELEIKSTWWEQVLATATDEGHPLLKAVVWNETVDSRDDGRITIQWGVTGEPELADGFGAALQEAGVQTGPVTEPNDRAIPATEEPAEAAGMALSGWAAWASPATLLLAVGLLWFFSGRAARSGWAYGTDGTRDARIDMLRGMAIVFVVVNHMGISSAFHLLTQETIGVVSGAELFVLLSGAVVGLVYGPRISEDLGDVVDKTTSRAWKLYVTALVVVIIVYLLSLLPFINAAAVTTFTDQGTGPGGTAGTTYDLYAGMEGLMEFPVPAGLIPALLLLQVGPWQFNVMGLYVVLLLLSPLILAALARRLWWLVLTVSFGLYAAGTLVRPRLLPSQFEDSFPLLVWQVLFILGLVAGYHRHRLVAWLSGPRQRWLLAVCLVLAVAFAAFSWSGPYLSNALDVRLNLLPEQTFRQIYDTFFNRTHLGIGRLLNVLVICVALYTLLSAYWKPLQGTLGWFLIPLGQATLYVFIMHVFLILMVANIPALREGNLWLNTVAYVVLLGALWVMVRTRFLFRLVPR